MVRWWAGLGIALFLGAAAWAQDMALMVNGHEVTLRQTEDFAWVLTVDGAEVLTDGQVLLDAPVEVAGETVLTGVAGAGGNACNAAPFVLVLPAQGPVRLDGPVDSCAYLTPTLQDAAIVWAGEATPTEPAEVWTWTPGGGFAEALPEPFAAEAALGWDHLPALADQHPVEALKLQPVHDALIAGLGDSWPVFAERIGGLGSGGLVEGGYLGEACLKFTCPDDYAGLYLDAGQRRVFAFWHETGAAAPMIWPGDLSLWPAPAVAALRAHGE